MDEAGWHERGEGHRSEKTPGEGEENCVGEKRSEMEMREDSDRTELKISVPGLSQQFPRTEGPEMTSSSALAEKRVKCSSLKEKMRTSPFLGAWMKPDGTREEKDTEVRRHQAREKRIVLERSGVRWK
ncbi:hypothetical protein NDU88_008632 [Pleurodeles waltl]|uniref:Uncharacterized protein n=1 Tax=Pleurodeles waltl TaxID=8319 RepID=A0AAV7RTN2_PLEWA|nr:hypothetical protein NDU88_008632 [Pleurodeles waltl]